MPHARIYAFVLVMAAGSAGAWADDPTEETEEVLVQPAPVGEPAAASEQRGDGKFRILPAYRAGQSEEKPDGAPGVKKAARATAARNPAVMVVRGGGVVSREAETLTSGGGTVASEDDWKREDGGITHAGTTTTSGGFASGRASTMTRDEGLTRDALRVTMSGRVVSKTVRVERETEAKSGARSAVTAGQAATKEVDGRKCKGENPREGFTKTPRAMIRQSSDSPRMQDVTKCEAALDAER